MLRQEETRHKRTRQEHELQPEIPVIGVSLLEFARNIIPQRSWTLGGPESSGQGSGVSHQSHLVRNPYRALSAFVLAFPHRNPSGLCILCKTATCATCDVLYNYRCKLHPQADQLCKKMKLCSGIEGQVPRFAVTENRPELSPLIYMKSWRRDTICHSWTQWLCILSPIILAKSSPKPRDL